MHETDLFRDRSTCDARLVKTHARLACPSDDDTCASFSFRVNLTHQASLFQKAQRVYFFQLNKQFFPLIALEKCFKLPHLCLTTLPIICSALEPGHTCPCQCLIHL